LIKFKVKLSYTKHNLNPKASPSFISPINYIPKPKIFNRLLVALGAFLFNSCEDKDDDKPVNQN